MIFTCCVLAIVLVCFLICVLRSSEVINTNTNPNLANLNDVYLASDDNSNNTLNSNSLLINLPFEKPPSYLDSQIWTLREIGQPPPIYTITNQETIVTMSSNVQNTNSLSTNTSTVSQPAQNELILNCNSWLEQSNNERSNLETRLTVELRRSELRRLSRDLEKCSHLPNLLSRCHSSPIIRNSLLLKNQNLIDLINAASINSSPINCSNTASTTTNSTNNNSPSVVNTNLISSTSSTDNCSNNASQN